MSQIEWAWVNIFLNSKWFHTVNFHLCLNIVQCCNKNFLWVELPVSGASCGWSFLWVELHNSTQPRIWRSAEAMWVPCVSSKFAQRSFHENPWNTERSDGTEIDR